MTDINLSQRSSVLPILSGVRVVDFSQRSPGPFATMMMLADFGADVVIVDPPPPANSTDTEAHNPLRRGKRSVCVDLKSPHATELVARLVRSADVVVDGFRPSTASRLGLSHEQILAHNADVIHCSLTGYGQTGPWAELPGHDLNYIASAGVLSVIGLDGRPIAPFNVVADYAGGGMMAAFGIMMALFGRTNSRPAGHIDVALAEGALCMMGHQLATSTATGEMPTPGSQHLAGAAPFNDLYLCADGRWLSIAALEGRFFAKLMDALGLSTTGDQWDRATWPKLRARSPPPWQRAHATSGSNSSQRLTCASRRSSTSAR